MVGFGVMCYPMNSIGYSMLRPEPQQPDAPIKAGMNDIPLNGYRTLAFCRKEP